MTDAYHLGGWGMYPTTIVGFVLLYAAFRYARDPEPRRRQIVKNLSVLTLLTSCLGFTAGVIKTFTATADLPSLNEAGHVALVGVGESLVNIGLGLCLLVMTWIMMSIGAFRAGPDARADLTDPHAH